MQTLFLSCSNDLKLAMPNNYFKFKQFTVFQDGAAMKVGTDGVLLGAWCSLTGDEARILDIGTGTGLIALMAAQRTRHAVVDAVEIDKGAAEQARRNAEIARWKDRINIHHASIQAYAAKCAYRYDRIISNPPFFVNALRNPDASRTLARHSDELPYEDLIAAVVGLLKPEGCFSAIFPYQESGVFVAQAAVAGLFCTRRMNVYAVPDGPLRRVVLEFSLSRPAEVVEERMVIEAADKADFSDEYKRLTADFYLKF